jgi:hemolysin activation/secretion protein
VLVVLNDAQRRLTGSFATDNTGAPETGEWQGVVTFSSDNLFGLNDSLLFTHQRSLDDPSGPARSYATSLSYSIPWGWWTADLQLSDSNYASVVPGITRSFLTEGDSRTAILRFDRVAYRDRSRKLTFYGSMIRRDSENSVAGERIDSSSRVLSLLDLQANLSIVDGGSLWSFDAGFTRGVPWLGALSDPETMPSGSPRAQFTKVTVGAGLTRGLGVLGLRTQLTSTLAAQWSDDVLYPSEQIAVTGLFSVRGYRNVRLFGDRGITWRNELALPFGMNGWGNRALAFRPFIGLDAGRIWSHGQVPGAFATGWAGGVNISRASANLQLSWSGAGPRSDSLASDHLLFARATASF